LYHTAAAYQPSASSRSPGASSPEKEPHMKKILSVCLSLLFVFMISVTAQNANSSTTASSATAAKAPKKRGPIFRASKDQVQQAQKILKDRTFYAGEQTGKLDADTRAGLKKFQAAESLKVTGTLNKITLEKMGVALTDKQKAM
jgi:peptidoglycan hydrolase-like protein with peptidoglycan-binding domain